MKPLTARFSLPSHPLLTITNLGRTVLGTVELSEAQVVDLAAFLKNNYPELVALAFVRHLTQQRTHVAFRDRQAGAWQGLASWLIGKLGWRGLNGHATYADSAIAFLSGLLLGEDESRVKTEELGRLKAAAGETRRKERVAFRDGFTTAARALGLQRYPECEGTTSLDAAQEERLARRYPPAEEVSAGVGYPPAGLPG
jgi:hypothetical protein